MFLKPGLEPKHTLGSDVYIHVLIELVKEFIVSIFLCVHCFFFSVPRILINQFCSTGLSYEVPWAEH